MQENPPAEMTEEERDQEMDLAQESYGMPAVNQIMADVQRQALDVGYVKYDELDRRLHFVTRLRNRADVVMIIRAMATEELRLSILEDREFDFRRINAVPSFLSLMVSTDEPGGKGRKELENMVRFGRGSEPKRRGIFGGGGLR